MEERMAAALVVAKMFEWGGTDANKVTALVGFDKETQTILVDESMLMLAIQIANPCQQPRAIKLVKREQKDS